MTTPELLSPLDGVHDPELRNEISFPVTFLSILYWPGEWRENRRIDVLGSSKHASSLGSQSQRLSLVQQLVMRHQSISGHTFFTLS